MPYTPPVIPTPLTIPAFDESWYRQGPGQDRKPAPGDVCYVLERLDDGDIIIRGGTVYSITVEPDMDTGSFASVNWFADEDDQEGCYETNPLSDTYYWFQDALDAACAEAEEIAKSDDYE